MKISELIENLEEKKKLHGDLEVTMHGSLDPESFGPLSPGPFETTVEGAVVRRSTDEPKNYFDKENRVRLFLIWQT